MEEMNWIEKVINFLDGKKTHITSAVTAIFNLLAVFKIYEITPEQLIAINAALGSIIAIFIRLGVSRETRKS